MPSIGLTELFIEELEGLYNAEPQIISSFPKLIKVASYHDLRDELSKNLQDTEQQLRRIEHIFELLEFPREEETCEAMQGILYEAEEFTANKIQLHH